MKKRLIVAYDPGEHVGVAWRNLDGTLDATMIHFNLPLSYSFISDMPDIVVYEDFETSTIDKHGLYTVRVVGGIQALCTHLKIPCVVQIPQARYPFREEAAAYLRNLRKSRKFVTHEMDALAHLLAYENRQKNNERRTQPTRPKEIAARLREGL